MSRNSSIEPGFTDEDIEAVGDAALGLTGHEDNDAKARKKMIRVGAALGARGIVTDKRKAIFIRTLAQTGIVGRSATAAGWPRGYAYTVRQEDPEFAKLWDQAVEFSTDALEEAARVRAVDGISKPVYQQKELVGYVTEYSDTLLIQLLKAKRPNEFRENVSLQADVKGGVLVVPGVASTDAWESAAGANQAEHRGSQGDQDADPLA
ncbi:terminase small subunit [Rhodobacter phage RcSimone-Hastad]|nr:terminase small subunit [Rhodobacter phage RcSimone-Hastad]